MDRPEENADARVREMEEQSEEVGEHIEQTRQDWERKQRDPAVPGAEGGDESDAER